MVPEDQSAQEAQAIALSPVQANCPRRPPTPKQQASEVPDVRPEEQLDLLDFVQRFRAKQEKQQ